MLISSSLYAQLSGVYTIGGLNPNYASFNQAVADLNQQGISDSTIFKIRNGVYNETVVIDPVQGASAGSPVIFESENGDSSLVVLQGDSVVSARYVLEINAASYIVFKGITFNNTGSHDSLVYLAGAASHLRFLNNQFLDTDGRYFVHSKIDSNDSLHLNGYNEFRSNLFKGNSNSRVFFSTNNQNSTYPKAQGNTFMHNNFVDGSSLHLSGQQSVQISENIFISDSNLFVGGCFINASSRLNITNNILSNSRMDVRGNWNSDQSFPTLIANNFICSDWLNPLLGSAYTGMLVGGFNNLNILFNTIHTKFDFQSNGNFSATLSVGQEQSVNSRIINNIIYNEGQTKALYVFDTADDIWDYNNIYTEGDTFASFMGSYLNSFSDWQQTTAFWPEDTPYDMHSLSIAPEFISDSLPDIVPGSELCGRGIWMDEVTTDIYGNARNNPPTIGAFELPTPCTVGYPNTEEEPYIFNISPNPATETLNIMYIDKELNTTLRITNGIGQTVYSKRIKLGISAISLSEIPAGVYLCSLNTGDRVIAKQRLVVVR